MKHFLFNSKLLAVTFLTFAFTSLASAQAVRTWVSGVGDDANICSRTAPCKTFAGALSRTAPKGEIDCLDPGSFGTFTITKALTIDCGGSAAFGGTILDSPGSGITISAGASDVIIIRNLSINGVVQEGFMPGLHGIHFLTGGTLHLENLRISNVTNNCIDVAATGTIIVTIDNTTVSDCGGAGVSISTDGANLVIGDIHALRATNVTTGIAALNGTRMAVRDSNIALASTAINQVGVAGGPSILTVIGSTVAQSMTALESGTGSFIAAFGNSFINDGMVYFQNGGQIFTGTDNATFGQGVTGATSGNVPKT